jgi:hypothetical protein
LPFFTQVNNLSEETRFDFKAVHFFPERDAASLVAEFKIEAHRTIKHKKTALNFTLLFYSTPRLDS